MYYLFGSKKWNPKEISRSLRAFLLLFSVEWWLLNLHTNYILIFISLCQSLAPSLLFFLGSGKEGSLKLLNQQWILLPKAANAGLCIGSVLKKLKWLNLYSTPSWISIKNAVFPPLLPHFCFHIWVDGIPLSRTELRFVSVCPERMPSVKWLTMRKRTHMMGF